MWCFHSGEEERSTDHSAQAGQTTRLPEDGSIASSTLARIARTWKQTLFLVQDECFPVVIVARYLHEPILHQNELLLDKAGPNGIAPVAGMKGNLLPRLGITTHEYYLSDRLSEAHSLQLV